MLTADPNTPLGGATAFTVSQFAPVVTGLLTAAAGLYVLGMLRVRRRNPTRPWPLARTASFCGLQRRPRRPTPTGTVPGRRRGQGRPRAANVNRRLWGWLPANLRRAAARPTHRQHRAVAFLLVPVLALAAGCAGSKRPGAPSPNIGAALDRPVPAAIATLPLTDDTGHRTDLAAWHGKVVVLTDFLTLCQDVCPLTSANYAVMDRVVNAAHLAGRVQFVELTVDPTRDTPTQLHAYRQLFNAPTNWSLLTGSPAVISDIWKFFGAYYQRVPEGKPAGIDWRTGRPLNYDIDHTDALVYIDAIGHERFVIVGLPNTQARRPPLSLYRFLSHLGITHLMHPDASTWTVTEALTPLSWLLRTRLTV